jgi:hypothetical protein
LGIEADGIERIAARLHPHLAEYVLLAAVSKARSIDEGFRDGLDGERLGNVADAVRDAVHGD